LWPAAQNAAVERGMDDLDASQAMSDVVHIVTDRLANCAGRQIRDIQRYIFKGYMNKLKRMARKIGITPHKNMNESSMSDNGAFMTAMGNGILCNELLSGLPPKLRKAVILRYAYGNSCKETAAILGLSDNAARKALCKDFRKIFGDCMRKVRKSGYEEVIQNMKKQS
jgi:hypothetical protein